MYSVVLSNPLILIPISFFTSLFLTLLFTPHLIKILVLKKTWRTDNTKMTLDGVEAIPFNQIQKKKIEEGDKTPRMGGFSFVVPTTILLGLYSYFAKNEIIFVIFAVFVAASLFGFLDDFMDIRENRKEIPFKYKLLFFLIVGFLFGLALNSFGFETLNIGIGKYSYVWNVSSWMPVLSALWFTCWISTSPIDGIDGLASTVYKSAFLFLGIFLLLSNVVLLPLAAICFAFVGALLGFHWFNITPAKFYMGEVGVMSALVLLASISFLSSALGVGGIVFSLFAGFLMIMTTATIVLQYFFWIVFKKPLFKITPIHHTFQLGGMPDASVVSRYSVVSIVVSMIGILLVFI